MAILRGKHGAVDGANTVRHWMVAAEADDNDYHASNTQGGTGRADGNKDWGGWYRAYGHTPYMWPGTQYTFSGVMTTGVGATGVCLCERVRIVCPTEEGKPIWHQAWFAANGDLTLGAATATDATIPAPPTSIGRKVSFDGTDQDDVRGWVLEFICPRVRYASSTTAGLYKGAADNIDARLTVNVYAANFNTLPTRNTDYTVKAYTAAGTYWDIQWMKILQLPQCDVPVEEKELVSGVIVAGMQGFNGTTAGYIKTPAVVTKWP
jgi:hypothetical protein